MYVRLLNSFFFHAIKTFHKVTRRINSLSERAGKKILMGTRSFLSFIIIHNNCLGKLDERRERKCGRAISRRVYYVETREHNITSER